MTKVEIYNQLIDLLSNDIGNKEVTLKVDEIVIMLCNCYSTDILIDFVEFIKEEQE